jgi:hypothetical protein
LIVVAIAIMGAWQRWPKARAKVAWNSSRGMARHAQHKTKYLNDWWLEKSDG